MQYMRDVLSPSEDRGVVLSSTVLFIPQYFILKHSFHEGLFKWFHPNFILVVLIEELEKACGHPKFIRFGPPNHAVDIGHLLANRCLD